MTVADAGATGRTVRRSRLLRALAMVVIVLSLPLLAHLAIGLAADPDPPIVHVPQGDVSRTRDDLKTFGRSYVLSRDKLLEVGLAGSPEQIGYAHARLLYDRMVENEGILLGHFAKQLSFAPARWVLLDLAQLRYRSVDEGMSDERRHEIAAGALGFQPDPYAHVFPTYQRFIYLNALYDIALSFEDSPLIGCTTFVLSRRAAAGGHALLARAFDFEVDDVFDEHKAVFLVREDGKIPFASVAWPGLVGVVSGMNAEGLAVVVHGGRAGELQSEGEPVVHALRRVLSKARTTAEAIAALDEGEPMVSHIAIVSDAAGHAAAVERVPGAGRYFFRLPERAVVTNHFLGPSSEDPKNRRVRERTSTVARYRRGRQLLDRIKKPAGVSDAVALLRDRRGINDLRLDLGDRDAIDALIATHGVVMDTTARVLWVSEAPHLLGRFVAFDLKRLLDPSYDPTKPAPLETLPSDPLAESDAYRKHVAARAGL
jgi:isopenicillin-N N-acyltransferase-like protein